MQAKDVANNALVSTQHMVQMYLNDLSDADLLVRPVPNANHIAWQIGHLIGAEKMLLDGLLPGVKYPEIPASIMSLRAGKDAPPPPTTGYLTKTEYLDLFNKVRAATIAAVDKLTDSDLDRPNIKALQEFAPNLGAMLILVANHTLMHAGQFTVVRRALNKPVLF
jgi:hypothetical protein